MSCLKDVGGFECTLSTYRRHGGTTLTTVKWIIKFFRSNIMGGIMVPFNLITGDAEPHFRAVKFNEGNATSHRDDNFSAEPAATA